ncbi:uncharacterized protein METZ01_LOCUS262455 [marine metagenome]|uniref:Uncharacterized protein n=1 Tax=marine metagenome TaxID=408172 RepID=A0A382JFX3_9ZZZZ
MITKKPRAKQEETLAILNIIFTSVYAYGLALHVSCLSKIYLLWKEEENSETVVNNI